MQHARAFPRALDHDHPAAGLCVAQCAPPSGLAGKARQTARIPTRMRASSAQGESALRAVRKPLQLWRATTLTGPRGTLCSGFDIAGHIADASLLRQHRDREAGASRLQAHIQSPRVNQNQWPFRILAPLHQDLSVDCSVSGRGAVLGCCPTRPGPRATGRAGPYLRVQRRTWLNNFCTPCCSSKGVCAAAATTTASTCTSPRLV